MLCADRLRQTQPDADRLRQTQTDADRHRQALTGADRQELQGSVAKDGWGPLGGAERPPREASHQSILL